MEESTPSEDWSQQSISYDGQVNGSSQYLEPSFYVKIAPVDDVDECSAEEGDGHPQVTNNSAYDMDTSAEKIDKKANIQDSFNVREIPVVKWGGTPITHSSDCPVGNLGATASNDIAVGEPLLIQPEGNFSSNVMTEFGFHGDGPMKMELEKVKVEPEHEEEEFGTFVVGKLSNED